MADLEICSMSLKDISEVIVVEKLSFSIPWSEASFIEEIKNNRFARYIVAKADGRVVGYAGMWIIIDEGHITNIAVHPEYRRMGIGSALMSRLIEIARAEGVESMTLEVRKSNFAAQKLYQKYGFKASGIRKGYYAGEDAIIMWKDDVKSSDKDIVGED